MMSATAYRTTHTNHHYQLGRKLDYGTYKQHTKRPVFIWGAYFVQLALGTPVYILLIPFLGFASAPNTYRLHIVAEYCIIVLLFTIFFTLAPLHIVLYYWLYPVLISSILTNLRGIASHALGDVENIYLSSRTIPSSKFISFLFLHENYHLEHHLFPRVPSYNLSKLHTLIWHRLPQAVYSKSYIQFLITFFKAAFKNDLKPAGVVTPRTKGF